MRVLRTALVLVVAVAVAVTGCKPKPADDRPLPDDPAAADKVLRGEQSLIAGGAKLGEPLRSPKVLLDAQNVTINGYRVAPRSALAPAAQAPARQADVYRFARGLFDHGRLLDVTVPFDARADVTVAADATFLEGASLVETLAEAGYARGLTVHAGDVTLAFDLAIDPPAPADGSATPCTGVAMSGGPATTFHDSLAVLAAALRTPNVSAQPTARFEACPPTSPTSPDAQGIGGADPPGEGNHHVDAPQMREGAVSVNGRLPPEVIQRIVRQHFGQLRLCYLNGLRKNPSLAGRVAARFLIDATGAVSAATDGGSDMPDKGVVACVVGAFKTLSFPRPEAGTVQVTYPIAFSPNPQPLPTFAPAPSGTGIGLSGIGESGGCPCGCDHSADMIEELRRGDRGAALAAIDDSLRTIGEREDAGYITERMVEHRLRLLDFGEELGRGGPVRFTSVSPIRATASVTTSQGASVSAELFLHGETTEIVRGAEKLLRTSFVLRLDLENPRAADVTLREPTLTASVGLPVSRWYEAGSAGRPWSGVLHARERIFVYVIGYAAEALQPGTELAATIDLDALSLPMTVRARKRWNEGS